ncbi:MAG: MATE family efflux transporter [Rhodobacteraceae bacterium]|nr:MATE family efflux transporter [Paracoccaceae bacterium]
MSPFRVHIRATLTLGLPLIGSQVATVAIGLTDTVMVGWYGVPELAAVALGASVYHVVMIIGMGLALAVMPLVAAAVASGNRVQARRVTRMGFWLAVIFSLATAPFFWFSGSVMIAIGQEPGLSQNVQDYLRIVGPGMVLMVLFLVLRSHLSALEHTRIVLWATLAGVVLNAVLNALLIFGTAGLPELGLRGAAVASLGTQGLMLLILVIYALRTRGVAEDDLFARFWHPDAEALCQVFRLGWPISLTLLSEAGLFTASVIMMGWIGQMELATHGIALQITSATFMVHVGLSAAATVRAGHAWGRNDLSGLRQGAFAALALSAAMVTLTVLMFLVIPGQLIALFLDPDDPLRPAIIALGIGFLAVAALFQLADAAQVMALGLLRGVQDTRVPMIYAVVSYWLCGVPVSYFLGFVLGLQGQGIWLGMVAGLVIAGTLMMARFWRGAARSPLAV